MSSSFGRTLGVSAARTIFRTIILLPFAIGKEFQNLENWRTTVPWLTGFSPLSRWVDGGSRWLAAIAIGGYQRYLSPYKRFACAHRRLHGGEPCSQYVKRAIAEQGLAAAAPLARQRFQACRAANLILHAEQTNRPQPDPPPDQKRRSRSNDDCLLSCFDISCDALSTGDCGGDRNQSCLPNWDNCQPDSASDCLPDDCTPDCDFGGCDLGDCSVIGGVTDCGADCGAVDCGSCDCG